MVIKFLTYMNWKFQVLEYIYIILKIKKGKDIIWKLLNLAMSLPIKTGFFMFQYITFFFNFYIDECKMLFNIFIFSSSFSLVLTLWREGGVAGFL